MAEICSYFLYATAKKQFNVLELYENTTNGYL